MIASLALALAAAVPLAVGTRVSPAQPAQSSEDEVLYVLTGAGGWLIAYDPVTLKRGMLNSCSTKLRWQATLMGLAYGKDRLFAVDINAEHLPDRFVTIHPSNGDPLLVGYPGMSQTSNWTLDFNPADGRLYA